MTIGPGMHVDDPSDDSLNLAMSESARPLYDAVKKFIADEVEPITKQFYDCLLYTSPSPRDRG